MSENIPQSLKAEHESLRATLKRGMREPGRTGGAARKVASIADGCFLREEKLVLPLLALLPALARGESGPKIAAAAHPVQGLKQEIGQMIADHRQLSEGLRELARVAEEEGKPDYVAFAEELIMHAHQEEEVLYPAAIVTGEYILTLRGEKRG